MSRRSSSQSEVLDLFKLLELDTRDREPTSLGHDVPDLFPNPQPDHVQYRIVLTNGTGSLGKQHAELE